MAGSVTVLSTASLEEALLADDGSCLFEFLFRYFVWAATARLAVGSVVHLTGMFAGYARIQ